MRYDPDTADAFLKMADKTEERFVLFYETYSPIAYTIALKLLKNEKDAEDVVQEVFIEIFQTPGQYDGQRGSVRAWVAVKTRSRCLDRLRKKEETVKDEIEIESKEQLEEDVLRRIEWEKTKTFLSKLPERQRQAVIGNYLYDQSHAQLSEKLNKPLGTVKSWVRQGLRGLRKQWFEERSRGKDKDKYDV
ncbi:RNA polymerase sigma factor [Salibacterium sp. K-3]